MKRLIRPFSVGCPVADMLIVTVGSSRSMYSVAPFWVDTKLPSRKACAQSSLSWLSSWLRNARHTRSQVPLFDHSFNRRQQVLSEPYLLSGVRHPVKPDSVEQPELAPNGTGPSQILSRSSEKKPFEPASFNASDGGKSNGFFGFTASLRSPYPGLLDTLNVVKTHLSSAGSR
jgi:hypothetical protein